MRKHAPCAVLTGGSAPYSSLAPKHGKNVGPDGTGNHSRPSIAMRAYTHCHMAEISRYAMATAQLLPKRVFEVIVKGNGSASIRQTQMAASTCLAEQMHVI